MTTDATVANGIGAAVLASGILLGRFAPTWGLLLVLALAPVRLELVPAAHLATLVLLGAVLGRAVEIARVLRTEPAFLLATLLLPLWVAASALWAWQPSFVAPLLGKWLTVTLAAWLAAADRCADPRLLVGGAAAAMAPHALWGAAERFELLEPIGEKESLRWRTIVHKGTTRGKALFWHPNRLGEYVEQVGLFLAGAGLGGVLPWACVAAVAVAALGVWGTGSMGSLATLLGGLVLIAAWMGVGRSLVDRPSAPVVGGAALAVALAAGISLVAYQAHGGIGTRAAVFSFGIERFWEHPWVGAGAGHWSYLVGRASLDVSRYWFRGHAHSLPLHVGVELGVVGVGALVLFFFVPLWSGLRRFGAVPRRWYGVGVGAAFAVAGLFAHNFVHYFLRDAIDGITTGLLLGTVIAVARRGEAGSP